MRKGARHQKMIGGFAHGNGRGEDNGEREYGKGEGERRRE